MSSGESSEREERWWRAVLLGTHSVIRLGRTFFKHLPSDPRCKLCAAPFRGAGAPLMRLIGKGPWAKNPKYCAACFKSMEARRGGIELECSFLFADVRGSTALAERMRPSEFRALMGRFYDTATHVLVEHDAIVDKFVGDEVIGIFIPALTGELHAARAIAAGRALLLATGHDTNAPWVPVGAGVQTGIAFVGTVGEGPHIELTALGDPVNVAARLASAAGAGEILVTLAAAQTAKLHEDGPPPPVGETAPLTRARCSPQERTDTARQLQEAGSRERDGYHGADEALAALARRRGDSCVRHPQIRRQGPLITAVREIIAQFAPTNQ